MAAVRERRDHRQRHGAEGRDGAAIEDEKGIEISVKGEILLFDLN